MPALNPSIIYGLLSSLSWGSGDFCGGVATKNTNPFLVVFQSQIAGLSILIVSTLYFIETISFISSIWAMAAGLFGSLGLLLLYQGLAEGEMGLTAPLTSVVSIIIPIIVSYFADGALSMTQSLGIALSLVAIIFLSYDQSNVRIELKKLRLPVAAGICFGLFFTLIDHATRESVFLPIIFARIPSLILLLTIIWKTQGISTAIMPERKKSSWIIAAAGILDSLGNVFFVLSAQAGKLAISAVIGSLYPLWTVLLAYLILKERLTPLKLLGAVLALVAIILFSL